MKRLIALFTLFLSIPLICQEAPETRGTKRGGGDYPEVKRPRSDAADDVTLISADGQQFIVPKKVAEQAQTIKYLIEEMGVQEIPIPNISSAHLKDLITIMAVLNGKRDESPKVIMRALHEAPLVQTPTSTPEEREVQQYLVAYDPWYDWSQLLLGANYLDLGSVVLDFLAKKVVDNVKQESDLQLAKEHGMVRDMDKFIARHYYLRFGQNLAGVDPNSYGFSINELLDHGRLDDAYEVDSNTDLASYHLSELRINSLDGLEDLPGIKKVDSINLSDNQLTVIVERQFAVCEYLDELKLDNNAIDTILPHAFDGLSRLDILSIQHNKISRLPNGLLADLKMLTSFNASHNLLEDLPPQFFKGRALGEIILAHNQFKVFPHDIFDGMAEEGVLSYSGGRIFGLNDNQLSSLPEDLFSRVRFVALIDLRNNNIRQLPETIFSSMPDQNLSMLFLGGNKLRDIPENLFAGLDMLERIDLSFNELAKIPFAAINRLPFLLLLFAVDNPLVRPIVPTGMPIPVKIIRRPALRLLRETDPEEYEDILAREYPDRVFPGERATELIIYV